MAKKENRWWEFYLVRYFIGTITGALIISYLTLNNQALNKLVISSDSSTSWTEVLKANFWIFILLGFAYCYISSAPILVFHACRAYFKSKKNKGLNHKTKVITIIVYIILLLGLIAFSFCLNQFYFLHWALLFIIIITQSILIIRGIFNNRVANFYKKLTADRKNEKKDKKRDNYIESYKHLREHGNAFSILIAELALGYILMGLTEINHMIIVISLWILPASYVWLIGTSLEFNIKKN